MGALTMDWRRGKVTAPQTICNYLNDGDKEYQVVDNSCSLLCLPFHAAEVSTRRQALWRYGGRREDGDRISCCFYLMQHWQGQLGARGENEQVDEWTVQYLSDLEGRCVRCWGTKD